MAELAESAQLAQFAERGPMVLGVFGASVEAARRFCVVPRNSVRAHAEMRQNWLISLGTHACVAQNLLRQALGGGTVAVRNVR